MCKMYSPGWLNVAVVVALPLNAAAASLGSIFSTAGRSLANETAAGPRYSVHRTVTGVPRFSGLAPEDEVNLASSETHTLSGSGDPTFALRSVLIPCGPCTEGPPSSKVKTG